MREPLTNRDPGDESAHQLTFPLPREQCPACGAKAKNLCAFDADIAYGGWPTRRPLNCLHRVDPSTAPFPEGY